MITDVSFVISQEELALQRLDRVVLQHFPSSSRRFVNDAIAAGKILLNKRVVKKSASFALGDEVKILSLSEGADRAVVPDSSLPLTLVYEDDTLLAVDKPAGQDCHPVQIGEGGTLASALTARYPELLKVGTDAFLSGLLHRLDAGTSGLLLAARTSDAWNAVRAQFTNHTAKKVYWALVEGVVKAPGGASGYLAHCSSFRGRMRVVSNAALPGGERPMFAETFWTPLKQIGGNTLLEVVIYTGVTHQIRCQLANALAPIVGDVLYGGKKTASGGYCLHAYSAELVHPKTGKTMVIRTKAPAWAR